MLSQAHENEETATIRTKGLVATMTDRKRDATFTKLFQMISGRSVKILETGTIRARSFAEGDGHSLLKFVDHIWNFGGSVISIDNNDRACDLARQMVHEKYSREYNGGSDLVDLDQVQVIHSDSVQFLDQHSDPIDVLYLDSGNDADLILREAQAAMKNLHADTLILVDDVNEQTHPEVQKGSKVIPYLIENGWEIVISEYQCLLKRVDQ